MTTKSVSWKDYLIDIDENGSVKVSKNGALCDNAKAALREIAAAAGFEIDEKWNTQQIGAKLAKFLEEAAPASTVKPKAEKKDDEPQVKASEADIAGARVRVYGKAQNRTALGIMHAYMVMYPQAKLEDIRKAFPDQLNPDSGVRQNFVYAEDKGTTADWNGFFKNEDELLTMGDGKKVSVVSMWTKPSFERLVAWAKQYGIVVADFEKAAGGGQKGSFRLEYLNGYIPPKQNDAYIPPKQSNININLKQKKGIPWWIWVLIAALIVLLCFLLFGKKKAEPQIVEVEKVVVVHDTLYVKQIAEIEAQYNAVTFVVGKADLSEEAKFVLHDLAKVMKDNPEIRIRLVGHTSAEGDAAFNLRLSEARAKAAVDFIVNHEGIAAERLEAVGKGFTELKNPDDPTAPENRRTEFIVLN